MAKDSNPMPAQLTESNPIDREGLGSTPSVGSIYRIIESIPRGRTVPWGVAKAGIAHSGWERCPVCLSEWGGCVQGDTWRFINKHGPADGVPGSKRYGAHCDKCKVRWVNTPIELCFVCDAPFIPQKTPSNYLRVDLLPFCTECRAALAGHDIWGKSRRTIRRLAGLRGGTK